ncbi:MAG: COX15/CtaA family protein [Gemmatimonadota bacterium]|nr:MAG: COX15/CtaA family protein [Gemmatimonadota bacterium]
MSEHSEPAARATLMRFAALAFVTAVFTYALIVFGGIVRITGSGMGCGNDWPLCNGRLIPPMDFETLIEYGHRLAALLVSVLVLAVTVYALRHRRSIGAGGRGIVGLAIAALVLLIVQILVGAVTVWLELPTATVVLHLIVASTILALLIIASLQARAEARPAFQAGGAQASYPRWVVTTAALGFVLILFGGLVANTGAGPLCQGFPLCNGQLFPEGGGLVHLHWTHRLLAYAMLVLVILSTAKTLREKAPPPIGRWSLAALILVVVQIVVAAALVLRHLPSDLRGLHLAVGVALWAALVVWATLALQHAASPTLHGRAA